MTAKEYFELIGIVEHKINSMKLRSQYYDQMSLSIPGPSLEKIGSNGTRNLEAPFIKWLFKRDEIDRQIKELEEELKKFKAEALIKIESLENEDYKIVLLMKYFKGQTFDDIAVEIHASRSTVKRWHNLALDEINAKGDLNCEILEKLNLNEPQ